MISFWFRFTTNHSLDSPMTTVYSWLPMSGVCKSETSNSTVTLPGLTRNKSSRNKIILLYNLWKRGRFREYRRKGNIQCFSLVSGKWQNLFWTTGKMKSLEKLLASCINAILETFKQNWDCGKLSLLSV